MQQNFAKALSLSLSIHTHTHTHTQASEALLFFRVKVNNLHLL